MLNILKTNKMSYRKAEVLVEMSSILRTDPEAYSDKKQKHLKGSTQKL
jgi:hypothetical protein